MRDTETHTGRCECGPVTYRTTGPLRPVHACHCTQCRRLSGHYWAATAVPTDRLEILTDDGLTWFRSSDFASRAFCNKCGSNLFWRMDGQDYTSIGAGTLDEPTGLSIAKHIFCKDKGDYYDITCTAPQIKRF